MGDWPTLLLVEDNSDDIVLFRRALSKNSVRARMQVISDGHDAIRYLKGEGIYGNRKDYPLPGLVVLDLHIPGESGLAVLRWIRKQSWLAGLPVVVFTGTDHGQSIKEALQSGADTYLFKNHDTEGLLHLLQHANLNWTNTDRASGISESRQSTTQGN
jgi:CheY-like chemotaxis protein